MPKIPMKPIITLKIGNKISPRFNIDTNRTNNWEYSKECPDNFSPISINSELEIFEKNTTPGKAWVKVYLPNTHNTMSLKISGAELSAVFQLIV